VEELPGKYETRLKVVKVLGAVRKQAGGREKK
jgi:hypothetical protein